MKNFNLKISEQNEAYLESREVVEPMPIQLSLPDVGGVHYIFNFPNGYKASVIKKWGSYGYEDDLWEIALLDKYGDITYEEDFDYDVIGYCSDKDIDNLLTKISNYEEA